MYLRQIFDLFGSGTANRGPDENRGPTGDTNSVPDSNKIPPTDMFWSREIPDEADKFTQESPPPFIVLLESVIPNKNVEKFNKLSTAMLTSKVISGGRRIYPSGKNRLKISCDKWADTNTLVDSEVLKGKGYKVYIPISLMMRKLMIWEVDASVAASRIFEMLDEDFKEYVVAIKR